MEEADAIRQALHDSGKTVDGLADAYGITPWALRWRLRSEYRWSLADLVVVERYTGCKVVDVVHSQMKEQ